MTDLLDITDDSDPLNISKVKERIVEADPHEHGIRKALNLGHTMGHAFESFAMRRGTPILHGYAVALYMKVSFLSVTLAALAVTVVPFRAIADDANTMFPTFTLLSLLTFTLR